MKILYNRTFHNHNNESAIEGSYRFSEWKGNLQEVYANGEEYISLVHKESYIKQIRLACARKQLFAEVYLTPESYTAACQAVGLAIKASEQGDFAAVRPPGHHAERDKSVGFCLFNNIAIAVQKLVNKGKKVFILDIDSHHGNGTQSIFYDSDRVFYASIHELYSYPFTGFPGETGEGKGKGYTLNIPLVAGSGDKQYLEMLEKALEAGRRFTPDVVAVSAGFDGYRKDRLLQLDLTLKAYYESGFMIRRSFSEVFAVLEGGYHEDIRQCTEHFVEGINVGARPRPNTFDHEMSVG